MDLRPSMHTQQKLLSTDATKKCARKVVVHNTKTATPTDDWILFPDDRVAVEHSSVRDQRIRRASAQIRIKSQSRGEQTVRPTMLPTPPGSSPAQSECKRTEEKESAANCGDLRDSHDRPTSGSDAPSVVVNRTTRADTSFPYRLPTPDISDVDEDEFFACCTHARLNVAPKSLESVWEMLRQMV
ncbi:MAG: hypothetical protein L6R35_001079 [Caloplaca aegaea]|nr:MAG: hypothetical protein L6R35_001079 [Caloplaca aegaea]